MTVKSQQHVLMVFSLLTMIVGVVVLVEINNVRQDVAELKRK